MKIKTISLLIISALIVGGCTLIPKVKEDLPEISPVTTPSVTTVVTPSIDETALIKTIIKKALVAKHGESANELNITVSKIIGNYSQGGASSSGGGGMWFAAKVNNEWKLVWDGNGTIFCSDLSAYPNFPASMIPECFDQTSNKMVKR